jgi:hypothetical protein
MPAKASSRQPQESFADVFEVAERRHQLLAQLAYLGPVRLAALGACTQLFEAALRTNEKRRQRGLALREGVAQLETQALEQLGAGRIRIERRLHVTQAGERTGNVAAERSQLRRIVCRSSGFSVMAPTQNNLAAKLRAAQLASIATAAHT